MKRPITALLTLLFLGLTHVATAQVDTRYVLTVGNGAGPSMTGISVSVTADLITNAAGTAPMPLQGWSFGICHDSSIVAVPSIVDGAATQTVNNGSPPDFNQKNVFSAGLTVAVVTDIFGTFTLPIGTGHELNVVTYTMNAPVGTTTPLAICSSIGVPSVDTVVVEAGSASPLTPVQIDGSLAVDLAGNSNFDRGDCDNTGSFNLSDMVFLLGFLFPQAPAPPNNVECMDACDANDDGSVNLQDVIVGLSTLFVPPSVPLPLPYTACGSDPTSDSLTCLVHDACP